MFRTRSTNDPGAAFGSTATVFSCSCASPAYGIPTNTCRFGCLKAFAGRAWTSRPQALPGLVVGALMVRVTVVVPPSWVTAMLVNPGCELVPAAVSWRGLQRKAHGSTHHCSEKGKISVTHQQSRWPSNQRCRSRRWGSQQRCSGPASRGCRKESTQTFRGRHANILCGDSV